MQVYGTVGVEYSRRAARLLDTCEQAGFGQLPVCIANAHLCVSSEPALNGASAGCNLPVRVARARIHLDAGGQIQGLS